MTAGRRDTSEKKLAASRILEAAAPEVDRNTVTELTSETVVIEMRMAADDPMGSWMGEQPGDVGQGNVVVPVCGERAAQVQHDAVVTLSDLDAVAADLMSTSVNSHPHVGSSILRRTSSAVVSKRRPPAV